MTLRYRITPAFRLAWLSSAGVALLGGLLPFAHAQDEVEARGGPRGFTEVTEEHLLSKVPNFFVFDYPYEPQPGKRLWLRVDDEHWIERYPDGSESRFEVLGRTTVRGQDGTVVVKTEGDPAKTLTDNEGGFQVFIPDKGTDMAILFRFVGAGDSEWRDMSWSDNRKTIIQKVE